MKNFLLILVGTFSVLGIMLFVNTTAHAAPTISVSVSDAIYADLAIRHYLDNVSLYYTDEKLSNDVKINERRHWLPASTVKTYAAIYAYKLVKEKKLNLSNKITVEAKNDVPTELVTDELPTLLVGEQATIDRLLKQMITQSDNTAFNVFLDRLGRDHITSYIQSIGLTNTHIGSKLNLDTSQEQFEYDAPGYGVNTTTAEDYAKAFTLIKKNRISGAVELLDIFKKQKINNMIPLLLPKDVVCAHKTGDLDPLYHDGGICQSKKLSYVLTIFTNAGDPSLLAHLSEILYTKNFNLVGQSLNKKILSENIQEDHLLDSLLFAKPDSNVLGTTTESFPIPEITAADLGIRASDLSLVIPDKNLPRVIVPADSPFHIVFDVLQIIRHTATLDPKVRRGVDLEAARIRLAEAKDLIKRGKVRQADTLFANIQSGLTKLAKDPTIVADSAGQNGMKEVSETRFAIFGDALKQTNGNEKISLIKIVADQARETVQKVEPKIPDAVNASNP